MRRGGRPRPTRLGAMTATPSNPSTAQARVLVDEMVRHGITDAVLCPGSRSAPLALALAAAERAGRIGSHGRDTDEFGAESEWRHRKRHARPYGWRCEPGSYLYSIDSP